jgi:uncharacterized protein YjbI with pentapeptide repeats
MPGRKERFFLKSLKEGKKDFIKEDMSYLNLSGIKIKEAVFIDCDFSCTSLRKSEIGDVRFTNCDFWESCFSFSSLVNVKFLKPDLSSCRFEEVSMDKCDFTEASSRNVTFRDSVIKRTLFKNSDLRRAVFSSSFFEDSGISCSNIEGSDFTYADISSLEITDCRLNKSNFAAVRGLSDSVKSFFKSKGAKVDAVFEKYLSYGLLLFFIVLILWDSKELSRKFIKPSSNPVVSVVSSDAPSVYSVKQISYEEYTAYVENNDFGGNLIKNGDFSSGLDWWMSSDNYYKTKGVVSIDTAEFHSAPACVRAVTRSSTRIHANSKDKDFLKASPYVNYTELKGYKELAFSFWYKNNPVNAYIINVLHGCVNMLSVVDQPCDSNEWNNFSAIISVPEDSPVGFEVEITFAQGESLVDDVELRGRR